MGTLLVRILVVLTALSASFATASRPLSCEEEKVKLLQDLTGIHRGAGEALKEMAQTQRQKKVDQCQTLEESQRKLDLKITQIEGRMDQGLDITLLLNRVVEAIEAKKVEKYQSQAMEAKQSELILALNTLAGRLVQGLDVIEAKMDTQVNETKDELRAIQASNEEGLGRVQDRLEAMKISNKEASKSIEALEQSVETLQTLEKNITHALKSLTDRLDVIEAKVDTQADEMKANQASCQEGLEAGKRRLEADKRRLEAMQGQLTRVASRRECWQPFERVGDDCVHWHDKWMSWAAARRYCRGLGGDLLVPSDKERFVVDGIYRQMSGPHPPLFDFLESKRIIFDKSKKWTSTWLGGSVNGDGKAAWTTGEKARGSDIKPHECISAGVHKDEGYGTFSEPCAETKYPVCHSL